MDLRDYRVQGPIPSCVDAWGVVHAVEGLGTHGGHTACAAPFNWMAVADSLPSTGFVAFMHPVAKIEAAITCMWCAVAR